MSLLEPPEDPDDFFAFAAGQLEEPDVSDIVNFSELNVGQLLSLAHDNTEALFDKHQALFPRSSEAYDLDSIRRGAQDELRRRGV